MHHSLTELLQTSSEPSQKENSFSYPRMRFINASEYSYSSMEEYLSEEALEYQQMLQVSFITDPQSA